MRRWAGAVLVPLVVVVQAACSSSGPDASAPGPSAATGATFEDYCATVQSVYAVEVAQTPEGVLVEWDAAATVPEPRTYVVHRRPAGALDWDRLEQVLRTDDDFTYLDAHPAEQPGTAYEYWVTAFVGECGGESELCPENVCEPLPAATPRQG